jgi:hypothetical protein
MANPHQYNILNNLAPESPGGIAEQSECGLIEMLVPPQLLRSGTSRRGLSDHGEPNRNPHETLARSCFTLGRGNTHSLGDAIDRVDANLSFAPDYDGGSDRRRRRDGYVRAFHG